MLEGAERVIQQVLVIDLIERQVVENALHVEELDHEHAVVREAETDAVGHGMELLQVEEDTRGVDDVERLL